jgi:hypothetical protein
VSVVPLSGGVLVSSGGGEPESVGGAESELAESVSGSRLGLGSPDTFDEPVPQEKRVLRLVTINIRMGLLLTAAV